MRFISLLVALSFVAAFNAIPAFADGVIDSIQANLMCQCGCTMVLISCDCGTAEQMRSEIKAMLDQGKTQDEILSFYVGKYGDKVLSAPKAEGFNLSAYITPFIVILLSALAIGLIVRRWVIQTRIAPAKPEHLVAPVVTASADPSTSHGVSEANPSGQALRAQLQKELSEFE